ncbi:glycoside hydrolase family 6 protein [Amycolatopsis albispora]|uniref:Glucanase n=1 Tax=Amycolatopsis albispora TaxID=1804986 RepID=A0A344LH07_9PSEU|nr:glycoside hydrolase family 6 protein [Amycolatopsis albispora]AXB47331.1 endoglucanase [Amycolatopsis albispora]
MRRLAAALGTLALLVTAAPATALAAEGNPLEKTNGFYVDPDSNPNRWVRDHASDPRATKIKQAIADRPGARWFGDWSGNIRTATDQYTYAADVVDKLPVLVAYNIFGRDCGSHSGGGAKTEAEYRTWISEFAKGIGGKPSVVILEPDALAQLDCVPTTGKKIRLDLLKYATEQLKTYATNTWVYLDAGHSGWHPAATTVQRLADAGVANVRGYSLNVSNYHTTADNVAYGNAVKSGLAGRGLTKTFVIDTSRNGNGPGDDWCNPAGRKLGVPSQLGGGSDLLLWVKVPGDSDGDCGIGAGIPAGQFSPEIAVRLIDGK